MSPRLCALIVALASASASCRHERRDACRARLTELTRFYQAVAAEQAASPSRTAVQVALDQAGGGELVAVHGAPADTSKSDVLVIGRERMFLVPVEGPPSGLGLGDSLDAITPDGTATSLVIEVGGAIPARTVTQVLRRLAPPEDGGYKTIALAYRVEGGAFAGKVRPQIEGFRPGDINLGKAGATIARDASEHCPALAAKLAQPTARSLPDLLTEFAPGLESCDCSVDVAPLEALAWMVREPVVTVVPLVATAPPLPDDATTWAELVHDHGGNPPAVALPPAPPTPPRPQPRRRTP